MQALWHLFGAFLLGVFLAIVVQATARGDEAAIGWALMRVSALSSEPRFEPFATESGCRIAANLAEEQGVEVGCVPILLFEVSECVGEE